MKLICFIIALIILGVYLICNFPLVLVEGRSMLPTFQDGSLLLATRLFNIDNAKIGEIYVYSRINEEGEEILVVKRLTRIHDNKRFFFFEGDNPVESYDSNNYGFIDAEQIIARVLCQIKK